MSRRDIRTATPDRSIWLNLPENLFRQHLVDLAERTNAVPIDPQTFSPLNWLSGFSQTLKFSHSLPLEVEQQVADDFASLVAVEEGAQSVAAVCVEEHLEPRRLVLRFAALDTTSNDNLRRLVKETLDILKNTSSDSVTVDVQIERLLLLVIELHHDRVLARLRSTKWAKPTFLSRSHKKPLWQDFPNLIHRAQFLYTRKERTKRQGVEKAMSDLSTKLERFEGVDAITEIVSTINVVESSHEFCSREDIKDFTRRLENSIGSKATPQLASALKSIRQIQKVAAYRRVCVSLVSTAKKYPLLFHEGVSVEYLQPYQSITTSIGYEAWAKTCHVHAEVQLIVYYDLLACVKPDQKFYLRPRCIGISKWLCYLCYQFINAHGAFFPSRTHGRLYDQWTIPDLAEFDERLLLRYRDILRAVDDVVTQQIQNEPELWRVEPMTSMELER